MAHNECVEGVEGWAPTEEEIKGCCGWWLCKDDKLVFIGVEQLRDDCLNKEHFYLRMSGCAKIHEEYKFIAIRLRSRLSYLGAALELALEGELPSSEPTRLRGEIAGVRFALRSLRCAAPTRGGSGVIGKGDG